jgi:hypothetical protein
MGTWMMMRMIGKLKYLGFIMMICKPKLLASSLIVLSHPLPKRPGVLLPTNSSKISPKTTLSSSKMTSASSNYDKSTKKFAQKTISKNPPSNL